MPNNYFQFKQFKVEQDKCAMKVCTDSCLFGAWIEVEKTVMSILDIGIGTGLLSLMLAQKTTAQIHGIEIDENAFRQANENYKNSIWNTRFTTYLGNVKTFTFNQQFDFIVCNPPFYKNDISSVLQEEKIAKHSLRLTFTDLITAIENLLTNHGKFSILLPFYRKDEFETLAAKHQFYPEKIIFLKQTDEHNFFRYAAVFSKYKNIKIVQKEVVIKTTDNTYSDEATTLLKPYYLHL